jgi:hypothetical protein
VFIEFFVAKKRREEAKKDKETNRKERIEERITRDMASMLFCVYVNIRVGEEHQRETMLTEMIKTTILFFLLLLASAPNWNITDGYNDNGFFTRGNELQNDWHRMIIVKVIDSFQLSYSNSDKEKIDNGLCFSRFYCDHIIVEGFL